ncbi:hypothetical protein VTI74DRAFT_5106 [Chaetomium olivicolor]
MPCQYYPPADLDELEEAATLATSEQQKEGLQVIGDIFNANKLPYGVMGGTNFYLRGSGRTTDDVDVAVTGTQSLEATLNLLNEEERVTRPRNKMSWLGGVARIFVLVRRQQVQIDLKWQRADGHGMPDDLIASTELLQIIHGGSGVRFFKIRPLVKAKFQSYGRGKPGDYVDLLFVCRHANYSKEVKAIASEVRLDKRELFLQEVLETNPADGDAVRRVLGLEGNITAET